jgi:hypothetical protein
MKGTRFFLAERYPDRKRCLRLQLTIHFMMWAVARQAGERARVLLIAMGFVAVASAGVVAQKSGAGALSTILVGTDPKTAAISDSQLQDIRQLLAIDLNSFPTQVASPPVGSAGYFSESFGPLFLERATVAGRRRLRAFASIQGASWSHLDGIDLNAGQIVNSVPSFLGQPGVTARASVRILTQTVSLGVNYGLFEHLELGLGVPLQHVCVRGSRTIATTNGADGVVNADACNSGIGDLLLKAKYSHALGSWWLGVQGILSPATGSPQHLTGKGRTQASATILASRTEGFLQPHINVGGTFGGDGVEFTETNFFGTPTYAITSVEPSPSLNFGLGSDILLSPQRLSLSAEVIGRALHHTLTFSAFDALGGASLESSPKTWAPWAIATVGVKYHVADSRFFLVGHASKQLTTDGLRPSLVVGFTLESRFP